jgi:hypothetical protein
MKSHHLHQLLGMLLLAGSSACGLKGEVLVSALGYASTSDALTICVTADNVPIANASCDDEGLCRDGNENIIEGFCVFQEEPEVDEGGCFVTGVGTFGKGSTRDSFGGNGKTMPDGSIQGEWQHVDHYDATETSANGQNLFHGDVEYLSCTLYETLSGPEVPKADVNYAVFGGTGEFNHEPGYTFEVHAFDHAEGGRLHDRYTMTITDPSGAVVLAADGQGTLDECAEDATVLDPSLAWVTEMGCLSGGNFQIHPPNAGHPY